MALNINREVEDTFYRYKMPKLQAKVEGKGNGIKTVIVNVTDIARALHRKPIYVTKYFGCELGAQINVDEKNERYIVNGAHDANKLQQLLDGFIKKFVLCPNCSNPETNLSVKKRAEVVKATCAACGATKTLDPVHRLTQFIMKNPPGEGEAKTKTKPTGGAAAANQGSDEDKDDLANASVIEGQENDDDWGDDATEEAQKQRMEELSSRVKQLAMDSDIDKPKSERAQMFFNYLSNFYFSNELLLRIDEVIDEADRLDLGSHSVLVLTEVILKDPNTVVQQMNEYAPLYCRLISESDSSSKSQLNLLNGLVTLVHKYPDMIKKVAMLVKTMYDRDVCEEEVILKWADKGPSSKFGPKKVHEQILAKCEVFFVWLREAEEEDSDEEVESVSGVELNGSNKISMPLSNGNKQSSPTVVSSTVTGQKDDEDDDDIDIDAI